MIIFVIAVRSAQVASDWSLVQRQAFRTTMSCLAQEEGEARCILVCHEQPFDLAPFGGKASFLEMDYAPPTREELKTGDHGDKWIKLHRGFVLARSMNPDHVMILDEDDLVSNRLGGHLLRNPEVDGWEFRKGYVHEVGHRFLLKVDRFDAMCGSSFIARVEEDTLPASDGASREDHLLLRWGHGLIGDKMREQGKRIEPLPFPGAIYMVGTGENCTDHRLSSFGGRKKRLLQFWRRKRLSARVRDEFGLTPLPRA